MKLRHTSIILTSIVTFAAGCANLSTEEGVDDDQALSGSQLFEASSQGLAIRYEGDPRIRLVAKAYRFPLKDGSELVAIDQDSEGLPLVVKYRSDGRIDRSFGENGIATEPSRRRIRGAILQADDRLVVMFVGESNDAPVIKRFDKNGRLDTTFGKGGLVSGPGIPDERDGYGLVRLSDTSFIGVFTTGSYFFTEDGTLDTSLGAKGKLGSYIFEVSAIDAERRILTASEGIVSRYLPNGRPDETFGESGVVYTNGADVQALTVDSRGRATATGASDKVYFFRWDAGGHPDPSFGQSGVVSVDLGREGEMTSIVVSRTGRVWATRNVESTGFLSGELKSDIGVIRLLESGAIDGAFDRDGKFTFDLARRDGDATLVLENGKMVMRGTLDGKVLFRARFR